MTRPTRPIVHLTMGRPSPLASERCVEARDFYGPRSFELEGVRGLLIGMGADEIHLGRHQDVLDHFLVAGGVVVTCAQVVFPYLVGIPRFEPIQHHRPADLEIHRVAPHPVWEGVQGKHLTLRKGVAGFYGRGCYRALPESATVINTIGPDALALDFSYRRGHGEVLVHGGNDIWGYQSDPNTSARLTPQLLRWVLDRETRW